MIYIVVRQTTDWGDEATFRAQLSDRDKPVVDLWDATFAMPYRVFRFELKRIAQLTWSRVDGAKCVPREEVPEGAVVVPTDDDDWFSPQLATALATAVDGRHAGYYWASEFLEVPISLRYELGWIRRSLFPGWQRWLCTTNNYALVMGRTPITLIDNHVAASSWFVANERGVCRVEAHLSVMNRTLASQTSLGRLSSLPSQAAVRRKFWRYRRLYRREPPPRLSWIAPYVAMMRDLMDALELQP